MPTNSKREVSYYRVRGGLTDDRGVCNEVRALRGVTHLRDRGFRTFRNARESLRNTHDSKVMDLMSFVNAVVPQTAEIPWVTQVIGSFEDKAPPTVTPQSFTSSPIRGRVMDVVVLDEVVDVPFSRKA